MKKQRRGLDRYNAPHYRRRSPVRQTTPPKTRSKRRQSVEPRWTKQQTKAPVPTGVLCRNLYSFVAYLYVNGSGSITSVGDERANLSAIVYL